MASMRPFMRSPTILRGFVQDGVHAVVEGLDFIVAEGCAAAEGVDAGVEEDFVGVGVAYAGEEGVGDEDALDLAGVAAEALAEEVQGEFGVQGVGAHAVEVGDDGLFTRAYAVDLAHDSHVVVAEVHAVIELQGEAGLGVDLGVGGDVLEAAGEHGVDGEGVAGPGPC